MEVGYRAFRPSGSLTLISGDAVAPLGIQVAGVTQSPQPVSYEIGNPSNVDAYLSYGATAAAAQAAAVIPTAGNPSPSVVWIPAKSIRVIRLPPTAFFSAITAGGAAGLLMQAGEGR